MTDARRTQIERVGESSRRLFQAAAELITEGSFDTATAAEIGRRAGYSRSMVHARFGSREKLFEAILTEAYESRLLAALPLATSGLDRVLARIGSTAELLESSPELVRTIFTIEFQAAGNESAMSERVAHWVHSLGRDIHASIIEGLADASIRPGIDADSAAHGIVSEGIGAAFIWIVNPSEDMGLRITQWRDRTKELLANPPHPHPSPARSQKRHPA